MIVPVAPIAPIVGTVTVAPILAIVSAMCNIRKRTILPTMPISSVVSIQQGGGF